MLFPLKQYLKLFDATDEDLLELENSCDNLNHDPYLKSRKVSMYRLGMDLEQGIGIKKHKSKRF